MPESLFKPYLNFQTILAAIKFSEPEFAYFPGKPTPLKYQFNRAPLILDHPYFDIEKETVIYVHGFYEGLQADNVKNIVKAYLAVKDHNLIVLDWYFQAAGPYFLKAVPAVEKLRGYHFACFQVGKDTAEAILKMIKNGLKVEKLHIIGYSLGAQLAGVIARTMQAKSNGKTTVKRISALDPAYPAYYVAGGQQHLDANDAENVDVIHTNCEIYGAPYRTGTIDFWPNGGLMQPGCYSHSCNHQRACLYWIESMLRNNEEKFHAIKSDSWQAFMKGNTDKFDPDIVMGINCPAGRKGNYYLQTNSSPPFARGESGINYISPPTSQFYTSHASIKTIEK